MGCAILGAIVMSVDLTCIFGADQDELRIDNEMLDENGFIKPEFINDSIAVSVKRSSDLVMESFEAEEKEKKKSFKLKEIKLEDKLNTNYMVRKTKKSKVTGEYELFRPSIFEAL